MSSDVGCEKEAQRERERERETELGAAEKGVEASIFSLKLRHEACADAKSWLLVVEAVR